MHSQRNAPVKTTTNWTMSNNNRKKTPKKMYETANTQTNDFYKIDAIALMRRRRL